MGIGKRHAYNLNLQCVNSFAKTKLDRYPKLQTDSKTHWNQLKIWSVVDRVSIPRFFPNFCENKISIQDFYWKLSNSNHTAKSAIVHTNW